MGHYGITHSHRLQRLQNRAARVTGRKNEHGQSELALNELNWVTLEQSRTRFGTNLMHTITHDLAARQLILKYVSEGTFLSAL